MSIKAAPDGRLFLVAKDHDNDGTPAHQKESRIWLYIRSATGVWGSKTIVQPDLSQLPRRPVLLLEPTSNVAYVIYHDSASGLNFITHSPMDNPSFDLPCVFSITPSNNLTSTKQNVTSSTGMMVAASTGATSTNQIVFRTVDLAPAPAPVHECDVSPRPIGSTNGTVSIADWVQMGRFLAGLDTPNPGSEFQRADSAPRSTLGDGIITIGDWVQCGRYAAGLDPVPVVGGPTGPPAGIVFSPRAKVGSARTQGSNGAAAVIAKPATRILMSTILPEPNPRQPIPLTTLVEVTSIRNNQ